MCIIHTMQIYTFSGLLQLQSQAIDIANTSEPQFIYNADSIMTLIDKLTDYMTNMKTSLPHLLYITDNDAEITCTPLDT